MPGSQNPQPWLIDKSTLRIQKVVFFQRLFRSTKLAVPTQFSQTKIRLMATRNPGSTHLVEVGDFIPIMYMFFLHPRWCRISSIYSINGGFGRFSEYFTYLTSQKNSDFSYFSGWKRSLGKGKNYKILQTTNFWEVSWNVGQFPFKSSQIDIISQASPTNFQNRKASRIYTRPIEVTYKWRSYIC